MLKKGAASDGLCCAQFSSNLQTRSTLLSSSETQGQLVGSIKCSILQKTFTTNILSTRLTAPGSPRMRCSRASRANYWSPIKIADWCVRLFIYLRFFPTNSWFALNTMVYWETREVTGRHKARTVVLYQILFVAHRSVKSWSLLHTLAENCLRFPANSYHMCSVRWS